MVELSTDTDAALLDYGLASSGCDFEESPPLVPLGPPTPIPSPAGKRVKISPEVSGSPRPNKRSSVVSLLGSVKKCRSSGSGLSTADDPLISEMSTTDRAPASPASPCNFDNIDSSINPEKIAKNRDLDGLLSALPLQ